MDDDVEPVGNCFEVRRALSHGSAALRLAPGPLWLGGLLVSIADGCGGELPTSLPSLPSREGGFSSGLAQLSARAAAHGPPAGMDEGTWYALLSGLTAVFVLVALAVGLLLFALDAWISAGFIRLHVAVLERGADGLEPLWSGSDRFVHMVVYKLLAALSTSAAGLLAAWPGLLLALYGYRAQRETLLTAGVGFALIGALPAVLWVGLGAYLGEHVVVLERRPPVRALRRSFELARGNRVPLGWFAAVCWLIRVASLGGLLLCVVGVLATAPFARALTGFAKTEGFLLFTRGFERTPGYRLWQHEAG